MSDERVEKLCDDCFCDGCAGPGKCRCVHANCSHAERSEVVSAPEPKPIENNSCYCANCCESVDGGARPDLNMMSFIFVMDRGESEGLARYEVRLGRQIVYVCGEEELAMSKCAGLTSEVTNFIGAMERKAGR